jgi:drug/metabolite transporter (DMT)-like permease
MINNTSNKTLLGIILQLSSTFFFTASSAFIKSASEISTHVDSFHLMFWRSVIGLMIVLIIGLKRKRFFASFRELKKVTGLWLIVRGFIGGITMLSIFTAISIGGDLGEVGALHKLSPIFAAVFSVFILKESLNIKILFPIAIAITGVFFIRNPFTASFGLEHVLILFGALGTGFILNVIRKLRIYGVESWLIVAVLLVSSLVISAPKVIIDKPNYPLEAFLFMIGAGVASTVAQLLVTSASRYLQAKISSILSLLSVFEFMIIGHLIFSEDIGLYKVIGGILIVVSSAITILISISRSKTLPS